MKSLTYLSYIVLSVATLLALASCSNDDTDVSEHDVHFCVQCVWHNGRVGETRALSATDILAGGTEDISIGTDDYPATINVSCSDGTTFTLTKGNTYCSAHTDYWFYTPSEIYKDNVIKRNDLTFTATAVIDGITNDAQELSKDVLTGTATKENLSDAHLQFTLHHTKALIRFAFKVSERYDKVRKILVTGISLKDETTSIPVTIVKKVLNKDNMTYLAYAYVDPEVVTTSKNTIECTYNIYDKDASFPNTSVTDADITANSAHLTRHDVTAKNSFTFDKVVFSSSAAEDHKIKAGYYYDLKVTLNPDYLYVLSDHDENQHLTIGK